MSVSINIENVTKRYGDNTVINGLSLQIRPGELFTLLGPSGCGKTTLLRMIIGFNSIEGGVIKVDNKIINDVPVSKRNMGMVFQNYAIFPHMSVKNNVAFGLKNRKIPKAQIEKMVDKMLEIVRIRDLKDRMPTELSGGQQQRVALARAIVPHPKVLLMDEPLSNLDAKLRLEMRNAIRKIQQQVGITTVYVTHDQEEALSISDRIAVMNSGVIQQVGSPRKIYERPVNVFVSTFIGISNIIEAKTSLENGEKYIVFDDNYKERMDNLKESFEKQKVLVSVRPQEFVINLDGKGIKGIVKSSMFLGLTTHYFVELSSGKEVEVIQELDSSETIPDGSKVYLKVKPDKINVFNWKTQSSLIKGVKKIEA